MPDHKLDGVFPSDLIRTRALMLWPDDVDMQRRYYAADFVNGVVYESPPEVISQWDGVMKHVLRRRGMLERLLERGNTGYWFLKWWRRGSGC